MENSTQFVDITPEGCKTPEGAQHVETTLDAFAHAQSEMANAAAAFVLRYNGIQLRKGLEHVREEWEEMVALAHEQRTAQDAFLRAVIGRFPATPNREDDVPFPWCDACASYHHPNNPTCRRRTADR